tara:strand:+ start:121 stop:807 length:687 start_codon:yes stop_codon:yes gene_type:complete
MRNSILIISFVAIVISIFFLNQEGKDKVNTKIRSPSTNTNKKLNEFKNIPSIVKKKKDVFENLKKEDKAAFEKDTRIKEYFFKKKLKIGKKNYYLGKTIRGIKKENYKEEMGELIKEVGDYTYFKVKEMEVDESLKRVDGFPVMLKKSNGILNVLTGTILLRVKSTKALIKLEEKYGFNVIQAFPNLNTYFVNLRKEDNILELTEKLKNEPETFTVEPEVLGPIFLPL